MDLMVPDRVFDRISSIDVKADLLQRGLTCALLDVDNTIRSRADNRVPADVHAWLDRARQAGVGLCILSNNWHQNVPQLAVDLQLPYVYRAVKPLPFGYHEALRIMGSSPEHAVMIGDQVHTDIAGARAVGMQAYLVGPLSGKHPWYAAAIKRLVQPERVIARGRGVASEPESVPAFVQKTRATPTEGPKR
jgi:HAD superfamily phosphatase (TIGR01668 family)